MDDILKILQSIERPGKFATTGTLESCLIGLEITGVGMVGFPIIPAQAQAIIQQCYQAPYGRGEETVLDREVRSTWQLDATQITLHNPQWQTLLEQLVKQVSHELGLSKSQVNCELYKLLMYEEGDFFSVHRDTEKLDNMFATLIVVLPSAHTGGELVVRHLGKEEVFSFGGEQTQYQMHYASFYADCQHEVKPIQSGYRCCLVYNLALQNVKKQPLAPNNHASVDTIAGLLTDQFAQRDAYDKCAILLEHQYSQASLSFNNLKNGDRIKGDVVTAAAQQAECDVYLAIVTCWESGYPDYDFDDWDEDDAEMEEVVESSLSIDHWVTPEGERLAFGEISIKEEQLIAEVEMTQRKPDQQEIQEAMGNAGASIEHWYHQAALVVWPRENRYEQIANAGFKNSVPLLKKMVNGALTQSATADECCTFAMHIIDRLETSNTRYLRANIDMSMLAVTLLETLIQMADLPLLKRFMRKALTRFYLVAFNHQVVQICQQYGYDSFAEELHLMAAQPDNILSFITLYEQLCLSKAVAEMATNEQALQKSLCKALVPQVLDSLKTFDSEKPDYYSTYIEETVNRATTLVSLFKVFHYLAETETVLAFIRYCCDTPKHYSLHDILIPALRNLSDAADDFKDTSAGLQYLLEHCLTELKARTVAPVVKPKDWRQHITLSCNSEDCQKLQAFLDDPEAQVYRFKARKERREYLQREIEKHGCDITCVTDRKGSPQTLVCTKNHASYEKRLKQWQVDSALLEELGKIQL